MADHSELIVDRLSCFAYVLWQHRLSLSSAHHNVILHVP